MPAPPVHSHELHKIEACLVHDLCMRGETPTQVGHLGFFQPMLVDQVITYPSLCPSRYPLNSDFNQCWLSI